jgi:hypothetical protein
MELLIKEGNCSLFTLLLNSIVEVASFSVGYKNDLKFFYGKCSKLYFQIISNKGKSNVILTLSANFERICYASLTKEHGKKEYLSIPRFFRLIS